MTRSWKLLVAAILSAGFAGVFSVAWAFFSTTGSGTAAASVSSLPAPTNLAANAAGSVVTLSWDQDPTPDNSPVTGYHVERRTEAGTTWSDACGSSATSLLAFPDNECMDTPPSDGSFVYRMKVIWRSWTALSDESNVVEVETDASAPTATITAPVNSGKYSTATFNALCGTPDADVCGTATDNGSVTEVSVSIERASDDKYWNGGAWVTSSDPVYEDATLTPASGASVNGAYGFTPAEDTYTLRARATDGNGNQHLSDAAVFMIDDTAPSVTVEQAAGQVDPTNSNPIAYEVEFSEIVSGLMAGDFTLSGAGAFGASVASVSGDGQYFEVMVSGADDGAVVLSLAADKAADEAGNGNTASNSTDNSVTFDDTAPVVTGVSSTLANGSYKAGQVVPVTVTFSEPVYVTGTPTLALATGTPSSTAVDYTSGTGTSTLTFDYTVASGNTSADLDYVGTSSLAINGGTITDVATNDANRTLASPGTAGSLGAAKNIVIDTTAPTMSSIDRIGAKARNSGPLSWTVTFSEPVSGVGTSNFSLDTSSLGGTAPTITSVTPSGTAPVTTWTVTASTTDTTGTDNGSIGLDNTSNAGVTDAAGNGLTGSDVDGQSFDYDTTAPAVSSIARVGAQLRNAGPLSWTVTFSEPVSGVSASNFTLVTANTGGTAPTIASVTPSGSAPVATWTVTTNATGTTGQNNGSIGLNWTGNAGVTDATANALTGATPVVGQTFTFDTVAPPAPNFSTSSPQNNRVVMSGFTDAEAGVTYECQFESTGWTACTDPLTFGPGSQFDGTHNYSLRAVDAAGNTSAATTKSQAA